ncbi:MAG: 5-(carboxyamino)imidazole ribonucleotide synthase [Leptospirales bacterium]|nr:5-(carboxyamino)imidazole ribonucleotide synthase [Leptospirales bacterium]
MSPRFSDVQLGVLGGGQLGRMLLAPALQLGLQPFYLDGDAEAPCSFLKGFVHGAVSDRKAVLDFGERCDLLTIEIEHVNCDALELLAARGKVVRPGPQVIALIQDKLAQKQFYVQHKLPTLEFHSIERREDLRELRDWFPLVQKLRRAGYDGRGVQVLRGPDEIERGFDAPSIVERLAAFEKEIAVIVSRRSDGGLASFPAVEMEFHVEANLVELLFAPASISSDQERRAMQIAFAAAEALQIEGLLAVEMFLLSDGKLVINEMAPRPHNSGHHTIEACNSSQYAEHLRAILGLPAGDCRLRQPAAMINLLGASGASGAVRYKGLEKVLAWPGVHVHLYGKRQTRPYRKMGHVTVVAASAQEAIARARQIRDMIQVEGAEQ